MNCDFTKGKCDGFESLGTAVTYNSNGAVFSMSKPKDAPTFQSTNYLFFGHVEIELQAAAGKGIITSLVLLSDDLDEIDFETVGADNAQIQSNYFAKGDDSSFNRGGFHAVNNPLGSTHKYAFDWTKDEIKWSIDGQVVRTLKPSDNPSYGYPQSPMQVKIGAWVAGYDGNAQGTIEWSGGIADFSNGPASAIYKSVKVVDYAGGSSPTSDDVKEYVYGDKTGSYQSIQVKLNDGSSSGSSSSSSSASSSTSASSASSHSSSATSSASSSAASSSTTMTTATSSSNATATGGHSGTGSASATSTPSSVPKGNAATRSGLALGAVAVGAFFALAL